MLEGNWSEFDNGTTTILPNPADTTQEPVQSTRWNFVFVVFCLVFVIGIMSVMLYAVLKRKRLDQLRHHLVPLYNFDPGECEDWEAELLEESEQTSQKKIQDYKSMSNPTATSQH